MREYQPFPISNFRTGFDESVEPWLLPRDAYQSLINAHLYRGVLEKIEGYTLFAKFTYRNIMSLGTPDGVTTNFSGNLPSLPVTTNFYAYGTIVEGSTADIFSYSSDVASFLVQIVGSAGGGSIGLINIDTGSYSISFNTPPPAGTYSSVFIVWDSAAPVSPPGTTAIMGIKQYFGLNGLQEVLVFNQKRIGKIINNNGIIAAKTQTIQAVGEIPHDYYQSSVFTGNGATTVFVTTGGGANATPIAGVPFMPGTFLIKEYTASGSPTGRVITDNGTGALTGTGVSNGAVNYVTGNYTITFTAAPANGNYFDSTVGVYGDIFTGSISDFFSLANYQYKAFFCNNIDRIFYYDGTAIHYLNTNLTVKPITSSGGAPTNLDITRCLHVFVYRERLLLISPTVQSMTQFNAIYWSTAGDPLNFTNDEQLIASTSEPIRAIGYINTDLVVRFSNSERVFRYTADAFSPFRFDSTNNIWACDAPYSTINYDSWFSSVGRPAIVGSDAVNVKRVDEIIPDFTDPSRIVDQTPVPFMSQTSIRQCYGERFDDLKEGWLCYNSSPVDQTQVNPSDNILAFNYMDGTYAVYTFPFSCLGFGRIANVPTWATTFTQWQDMGSTWDAYQLQSDALIDLAGDQFNNVYNLNAGTTLGDDETPVLMSVISKNFNPFIEQGQLCRFGYLDLFVSASQTSTLRVQFYLNDELYIDSNNQPAGFYQETKLVFNPKDAMSPSNNQIKVWKRIYVGAVGKEHTIRFYQNEEDFADELNQPIYIHAIVPYMKPAGRIFN